MGDVTTDGAIPVKEGSGSNTHGPEIRVYRRRWLILALFFLVMMLNSMPWMQYTVVADAVTLYFGVSNDAVEWTGMVYNVTAMVLVLPAAFLLDKYGLRPSVLVGSLGTALGLWLRVLGCWRGHFWAVVAGHAVVSAATNFLTSAPPRVAAVWFPSNEVSSAMGTAIIGQTVGVSLGCMLAPLTARATWTQEDNFRGFLIVNVAMAAAASVVFIAVFIFFQEAPAHPPSPARAAAQALAPPGEYFKSVRRLCRNGAFLLLLVSFVIIVSVYVAITTLLNRDIIEFFPDRAAETGLLATLLTLAGMVATFIFGILLDKFKAFKELSAITYFGGLVSVAIYSGTIAFVEMEAFYVVVLFMGVFLAGCFVPAYEWAVELTYPEPEGNPMSLLNWIVQPCSLVVTLAYSRIFSTWGSHAAHCLLGALMAAGFLAQLCVPKRYLRMEGGLAKATPPANAVPAKPTSVIVPPPSECGNEQF